MLSNHTADLSLRWSLHLVDALTRCGVKLAYISPGSRSTPLVLALLHHHDVECHSVLDERSAAYMALGSGKQTGVPALFICTSGTAVANASAAVVESRMSKTPLILLTADRPPLLRGTGASQTIDQMKFFGDYPVWFFDTGEPVDSDEDFRRLYYLGMQSYVKSVFSGGPVHLNIPFRKPLEPEKDQICKRVERYATRNLSLPQIPSDESSVPDWLDEQPSGSLPQAFCKLLSQSRRMLVVAGPGSCFPDSFISWCTRLRIPVLCETGGLFPPPASISKASVHPDPGNRNIRTEFPSFATCLHPFILNNPLMTARLEPDLILRTGSSPVHGPTQNVLLHWKVPQIIFGNAYDGSDTTLSSTHHLKYAVEHYRWPSDPPSKADSSFSSPQIDLDYVELWEKQILQAAEEVKTMLDGESRLTDGHVYDRLMPEVEAMDDAIVMVSNSFPLRDYLLFGPQSQVISRPLLLNRGASGIDGITSTAIGAAVAARKPVVLFTGDLAFFHDGGALHNLANRAIRLKIVVINNQGGNIFRMLPLELEEESYRTFFETPQNTCIQNLAAAHGIPSILAESPDELIPAWKQISECSIAVLECRTHGKSSLKLRRFL